MKKNEKISPFELHKRNEFGLLENVKYIYQQNGSVDWRSMIDPSHLYPNKSWFQLRKKTTPTSTDGLEDSQLLIKLSGIKELAKLRGFNKVSYDVIKCELDHVAVKCNIEWIGNYESEGHSVYFEDLGNATSYNTSNFAVKFLECIATNRAFVRCVRNFLNIHILGADEMDSSSKDSTNLSSEMIGGIPSAQATLNKIAQSKGYASFSDFKDVFLREAWSNKKYQNSEAKDWNSYEDISPEDSRKLIVLLRQH